MDERRLHDDLESLERAVPAPSHPALPALRRRPLLLWLPAGIALVAGVLIGLFGAQLLPREGANRQAGIGLVSSGAIAAGCQVTKPPQPPFVPATGPVTPPESEDAFWYGTDALWTMPGYDGTWSLIPGDDGWYRQKTFWWSVDFAQAGPGAAPLTITGRRLDGPAGSVRTNPPVSAMGFFNSGVPVGIELPTPGCWELTATYRGHSLSYTVWVESRPALTVTLAWHEAQSIRASYMTVVRDRVLAFGGIDAGHEAAWYSDDGGESWQHARVSAGPGQSSWVLGSVAEHDGHLMSLGSAPNAQVGADADRRSVLWTSNDQGATWSAVGQAPPSMPGDARLAAGGPGFVAVGNPFDGASGTYTHLPQVWTSGDGTTWARQPENPLGTGYVDDVAARGRIVAIGSVGEAETSEPMAWWSDDGIGWHAVALPEMRFVSKITTDSNGFVIAGVAPDTSLRLLRSVDGEKWQSVPTAPGPWEHVLGLAAGPLGIVVAGDGPAPSEPARAADAFGQPLLYFLGRDGQSSLEHDLDRWPSTVVATQNRFVALATGCPPNADCLYTPERFVLIARPDVSVNVPSEPEPACEATPITRPPDKPDDPRLWMKAGDGLWAIVSGQVIDVSEGHGIKILWMNDEAMRGPMTVDVASVGSSNYRKSYRFDPEPFSGMLHPSGFDMPPPGCYRFSAQVGTVSGQIVLEITNRAVP